MNLIVLPTSPLSLSLWPIKWHFSYACSFTCISYDTVLMIHHVISRPTRAVSWNRFTQTFLAHS